MQGCRRWSTLLGENFPAQNAYQTNVSSSDQSKLGDADEQAKIEDVDDEGDGVADDTLRSDVASESERTGGGGGRALSSA